MKGKNNELMAEMETDTLEMFSFSSKARLTSPSSKWQVLG